MPGSILINDGRRSASPDRRVTFGNIERYDIMTSNEIKNNIQQKRGGSDNVSTVNGNYPMTRLDNRIRKAIMLGFTHEPSDSVTYADIVDFLMEFGVIVNPKVCNERQITAIIQSSFPKVIVKPSAKHSIVFLHLENRSDEVVKEELVRVTTEPIVDIFMEAQAWIKEESDGYQSDEGDDEELSFIEKQKSKIENEDSKAEELLPKPVKIVSTTPTDGLLKPDHNPPIRERAIDVPDSMVNSKENKNGENDVDPKAIKEDKQITVRRSSSFSKSMGGKSLSVTDMAKRFEHSGTNEDDDNPGKSNLQRKRSFTRSTDRSFVGSIRDRFRSSSRKTGEKSDTLTKKEDKKEKKDKKEEEKCNKKLKKEETEGKKNFSTQKKNDNNTSNMTIETPLSIRKYTPKTRANADNETNKNSSTLKATMNNDARSLIRINSDNRKTYAFGGSCNDVRSSFRNTDRSIMRDSSSASTVDIQSSFRANNSKATVGSKNSFHANNVQTYSENKSTFQRANTNKLTTNGEVRSSFRRAPASKTNSISGDNTTFQKGTSVRNSLRVNNIELSSKSPSIPRAILKDTKNTAQTFKRTDSRKGLNSKPTKISSKGSSASSTPSISRENSKTNLKAPVRKPLTKQEKDLVRIAKAFQKATNDIDEAKDNIENFMINVATEDLEQSINNRLKLDDLYDHIRHRMIIARDMIFKGCRTDVTIDMSQYFDLLFKILASHFERIGCEMVTDTASKEKVCFLIHLKLVDYVDDLSVITAGNEEEEEEVASYV